MKKRILSLVLALMVVLSGCEFPFAADTSPTKAAQTDATTEYSSLLGAVSEKIPPVVTEKPEIPVEPKPIVRFRQSWTSILADRGVTARHYFVYDYSSAAFLTISGSQDEVIFPASVTKLFSAYVALQYISADEYLTAGSELELIPWDASVAGLELGDKLTVAQLIGAMLLPSGNDATHVLAAAVGRILSEDPYLEPQAAVDRFVEQMNIHAQILGLNGTHFVTPDGMHDVDHYTCPADLVQIGMLALNDPVISQWVTTNKESIVMDEERTLEWKNTNILLDPECEYYCPYTIGLKTGFTTPAGNCLLSAFQVDGQTLLIGIFGCEDAYDRYAETLLLFTQAYGLSVPGSENTLPRMEIA